MVNKNTSNIVDILILIISIIALILIPSLFIGVRYDIVGEVVGIIGTLTAVATSIATIIYNENARKKQNEYQYQKDKLEKTTNKLSEVLYEQIEVINPMHIINVPIDLSNPNKMIDYLLTSIMSYKFSLIVSGSRIYWYYDDEQYEKSQVLKKFMKDLEEVIRDIDLILNELMAVLREIAAKLNKYEKEKALDTDIQIAQDIINDVTSKVRGKLNELAKIKEERVELLYDKAKCVVKEYEVYKYERIEK